VAEGRAMRRAIANDFAALPGPGARVIVPLDAQWPDDPGPWTIARIAERESPQRLFELARRADYTVLIAPETMGVLASLTRGLEHEGARSLGSSAQAVELTGNKARLAEWLLSREIATPRSRTIIPSAGLPKDAEYPAVLKPIDGAGSVETFFLANARSLPDAARQMPVALLQPFHSGIPMSASFLIDNDERAWLTGVGKQSITVQNGRFQYWGGRLPAPCRDAEPLLRRAVKSIPGLRGFVGVDFLWEPARHEATVLEINPRPTTSYVGLSHLLPPGHLAQAWLAACGAAGWPRDELAHVASIVQEQQELFFDAEGNLLVPVHRR
jgi:tyramine---L-glutamate ligase